jgi:hypothetical protein
MRKKAAGGPPFLFKLQTHSALQGFSAAAPAGADVLDHAGGTDAAELSGIGERVIACKTKQEAGGEEIAGAGQVNDIINLLGRNLDGFLTV